MCINICAICEEFPPQKMQIGNKLTLSKKWYLSYYEFCVCGNKQCQNTMPYCQI